VVLSFLRAPAVDKKITPKIGSERASGIRDYRSGAGPEILEKNWKRVVS
jgi:hypothetical protein